MICRTNLVQLNRQTDKHKAGTNIFGNSQTDKQMEGMLDLAHDVTGCLLVEISNDHLCSKSLNF